MQSADSITTSASVLGTRRLPHEYERDTLSFRYEECKSCRNRTQLTCIKCGFCYSCHWKKEEVERRELRNKLDEFSRLSSSKKDDELEQQQQKEEEEEKEKKERQDQAHIIIVDVFGQKSEPICTYYRCHHKFSLHGLSSSSSSSSSRHGCKCKHPMNKTLGVFKRYS
jgi:hypothetical protein